MPNQKTPWFKNGEKPVRDGVYERPLLNIIHSKQTVFTRFEGGTWYAAAANKEIAAKTKMTSIYQASIIWRGLLK